MRTLAIVGTFIGLCGCVASQPPPSRSLKADLLLVGSVNLAGEFEVYSGDVAEAWKRYSMHLADGGKLFEFVSSGQNCPIGSLANQDYLIALKKSKVRTSGGSGGLYETAFCIPLDATMATGMRRYSKPQ